MHWCREFGKGVCIDGNVEKEASAIGRLPGGRVRLRADDLTGAVRLYFPACFFVCAAGQRHIGKNLIRSIGDILSILQRGNRE